MDNRNEDGNVYIVQLREFINNDEPTYKIGFTLKENPFDAVVAGYPKGTQLMFSIHTENPRALKKKAITLFKSKYSQKTEYGDEYFNGNLHSMISDIAVLSRNRDV
jgi:hypothetical protein